MSGIVPFLMNLRMEKVAYLMSFNEFYSDPMDIHTLKQDISTALYQCKEELKTLSSVEKAWGKKNDGNRQQFNVNLYLTAGILKMRTGDFDGLKWCVDQILKEVGSLSSPYINLNKNIGFA